MRTKEKCWEIKDVLPVNCTKLKNRYGEWRIVIPKMSMSYDVFMEMESSLSHMESYGVSYDYVNGIATLNVTDKGLKELESMSNVIRISS